MTILTVNEDNLNEFPQVVCFINAKNEHHGMKITWLRERFREGLRIKVMKLQGEKSIVGFVEYVPGEYAWRAVNAKGFMFIHCMWISPNKYRNQGFGRSLLEAVVEDAREQNQSGVVAMVSDGAFMIRKDLFLKNGFEVVQEEGDMQLVARRFNKKRALPLFNDVKSRLAEYQGWHIVYSKQCPWVARFMEELKPILKREELSLDIHELTSALEAQNAPSHYATFNLIKDGRLLADRYISTTRFMNILKKERR